MLNNNVRYLIPLFVTTLGTAAIAHPGPRIWLGIEEGKIVTYSSDNDTAPTLFTPSQVFLAGGLENAASGDGQLRRASSDPSNPSYNTWTTNWPGHQAVPSTNGFSTSNQLSYQITDALWVFDGNNFVSVEDHFGASAPQVRIAVNQPNPDPSGPSTITVTTDTAGGAVEGDTFFYYGNDTTHAHPRYTLLGDGAMPGNGPDGIYALTLQLTAPGLVASDPYVLLMAKNYSLNDPLYQQAIASASTLVPEPATVSLLMLGGAALLYRRRAMR